MSSEQATIPRPVEVPASPHAPHEPAPATPGSPGLHVVGNAPPGAPASDPVVIVRDLGKCYHVYDQPFDRLKQAIFRWRRRYYHEFWALRGVTFEVHPGDAVGILGRNGSGKSTLLQLIAGTLTPTEGEVRVRGRIAAMLELGSGFNPEFTGSENVFLAGSILGIPRREIEQRFDSIAAFADIGAFLEQPVKTYSSGMAARLAFAVAFSVDPDLLIVDEMLAVGDIGFQQRCIARLRQLRDAGMTLLFVSHSPDAVRSLCTRAIFLEKGQLRYVGQAERTTDQYLAFMREQTNQDALAVQKDLGDPVRFATHVPGNTRYGMGQVQIEGVRVLGEDGEPRRAFNLGETVVLEADVRAYAAVESLSVSFLVRDFTGVDLMGTTTFDERVALPRLSPGHRLRVRFRFENALRPGNFGICLAINRVTQRDYSDNVLFDQVDGCAAFVVMAHPQRPVHYKFHKPIAVQYEALPHA